MLGTPRTAVKEHGAGWRIVTSAIALLSLPSAGAHGKEAWNAPQLILSRPNALSAPVLLADPSAGLHLFFALASSRAGSLDVLVCLRREGNIWSPPIELPTATRGTELRNPAVALDERGWLQVVWRGRHGQIEYSRAHVAEATSSAAWSRPRILSDRSGFGLDIQATSGGLLHLVYASGSGQVQHRRSANGGWDWSRPVTIFDTDERSHVSDLPRLVSDRDGHLHAVWSLRGPPPRWPPASVYYARSTDRGETWSAPLRVADGEEGEINVAAAGAAEIHLVWHSSQAVGRRMHRWSRDGGRTWSEAGEIDPSLRGTWTGVPAIAVDGTARLHLATLSGSHLFHLLRDRGSWSEPSSVELAGDAGKVPAFPRLAVSGGNHLHLVFQAARSGIWHSNLRTEAVPLALRPIPTKAPPRLAERLRSYSPPFLVLLTMVLAWAVHAIVRYLRPGRSGR